MAEEWHSLRRKYPGLSFDELSEKFREIHNANLEQNFPRRRIPTNVLHGEEEIELDLLDHNEEIDLAGEEIAFGEDVALGVAEDAALLTTGVAEGAGIGGSVLAGGAILGGAAAAGAGISQLLTGRDNKEEHKDPIITLPGHKYIGPGNTIDKGAIPVDYDDEISEQHDREYANAKTQLDIYNADSKYLNKAVYDTFARGNPHSAVGAIGIGTKHAIEKVIGVKYPAGLPKDNSELPIDNTIDETFLSPSGTLLKCLTKMKKREKPRGVFLR